MYAHSAASPPVGDAPPKESNVLAALVLAHRDAAWLIPCILALWAVGVILGFDDRGNVFRGSDPAAPFWGAWGLVVGVLGIWQWRRFLNRDDFTRPAHDSSDDLLWLFGAVGCLAFYVAIVPSARLLPPNATMCVLCGLAGAKLVYSGMTRRIGRTFHCAHCNYEITDTSLPRRCPECSAIWARRLARGRVVRSVKLISVGALLLFVLSLAPLPRIGFARSFILRQMSTAWILTQAQSSLVNQTAFDPSLWSELSRRNLTEAQSTPLAEIVLRQNAEHRLHDYEAKMWLQDLVISGRASNTVADALLTESLQFQLVAPWSVPAHSPLPIGIQIVEFDRLPRDRLAIYLDSVTMDGDQDPVAPSAGWELLSDAMASVAKPEVPVPLPRTPMAQAALLRNPPAPLPASPNVLAHSDVLGTVGVKLVDMPGPAIFRARVWVAIIPSGSVPAGLPKTLLGQTTAPGGTPLPFLKAFDMKTEVTVVEKPAVQNRRR